MDEGGFEPPRANTAVLKTAPLDLTRAPILINTMRFYDIFSHPMWGSNPRPHA